MEDFKSLNDIFSQEEMFHIAFLISLGEWNILRAYLRSMETRLAIYGVVPDYLFYWLQHISTGKGIP